MGAITFNDKVRIRNNPNVPRENKIIDLDVNELKHAVVDLQKALGIYENTFDIEEEYNLGDLTIDENQIWESLTDENIGNIPSTDDGTNWTLVPILVDEQ